MNKLFILASAAILSMPSIALAASKDDCTAMWKKADAKSEGKISGDMAKPYVMAMDAMKMPAMGAKDGVVTGDEFMAACQKDAYKDIK
jgi:hypothetical protein